MRTKLLRCPSYATIHRWHYSRLNWPAKRALLWRGIARQGDCERNQITREDHSRRQIQPPAMHGHASARLEGQRDAKRWSILWY